MAEQVSREALLEAMFEAGFSESDLREDYSGRGMFGRTCPGVVGNEHEYMRMLVELARSGHADDANKLTIALQSDNMGLRRIFYFPGIELV